MSSPIDALVERMVRGMARRVSRRSFLGNVGALLFSTAGLPLLPVARGELPTPARPDVATDPGDPQTCEYWRHCAIDGFLCACCGGSAHSCPPGTEASAVTWVGTCHNPADGHDYIVSYNDCCGKSGAVVACAIATRTTSRSTCHSNRTTTTGVRAARSGSPTTVPPPA